jgi:hypothetical protein
MSQYALIVDGVVENVVEWDGETRYEPVGELVLLVEGEGVGIGWKRNKNNKWVAPPAPVVELPE